MLEWVETWLVRLYCESLETPLFYIYSFWGIPANFNRRQMRGRAGRKGKDEVGETYLCCQKADLEAVAELLEAEIPAIESCLGPEKKGVKRSVPLLFEKG